jgi:hypothetical protein
VRALVADLISDAVGSTVSTTVRETVEAVVKLDQGQGVKVHDLTAHLDLERSTVQYRVTAARERGYLVNLEEKRGKPGRYQAGSPLPQEAVILPERIEGVKPHPAPAHHIPDGAGPQASEGSSEWCEGVNEPQRGQADDGICTECGALLDPVLGWPVHPWCDPGPPMTAAELAAAGFPAGLAEDTAS